MSVGVGAFKDVVEEEASFYVFRDDILLFPMSYSIPKATESHLQ